MSSAIIRSLQQDVFNPSEERLIACCNVSKYLKKKKTSLLCLVGTTTVPFNVFIIQIKQSDKQFKRKRSWSIAELKSVDGHSELPETLEFDLYFDKVYRWVASGSKERYAFIHNLWKQVSKHVSKDMAVFKNVPQNWITEDVLTPENNYIISPLTAFDSDMVEDFQAITEKEQEDLKRFVYVVVMLCYYVC